MNPKAFPFLLISMVGLGLLTGYGHDTGHDHAHVAGPNGGRLIASVEPHVEFLVTKDRRVQLTFLEKDNKTAIPPTEQVVSVVAGKRFRTRTLKFSKHGSSLLSDKTLPKGDNLPTTVTIQLKPGAEKNRVKFHLAFSKCSTCSHLEYACVCGHNHKHDDK